MLTRVPSRDFAGTSNRNVPTGNNRTNEKRDEVKITFSKDGMDPIRLLS